MNEKYRFNGKFGDEEITYEMTDTDVDLFIHSATVAMSKFDPRHTARLIKAGIEAARGRSNGGKEVSEAARRKAQKRRFAVHDEFSKAEANELFRKKSFSRQCDIIRCKQSVIDAHGGKKPSAKTVKEDILTKLEKR